VLFMLVLAPQHIGQDSCHWPFTLTQPGRRLKVPLPSQEERVGETPSVRPWRLGAGCGHESWSAQGSSATHSSKGTGVGGDVAQWLSGTTNTFLECVLPTEPRTGVLNIHVSRGQ
jgi:hypothetical protein